MKNIKQESALITIDEHGSEYAEVKDDIKTLFKSLGIQQRGFPEEAMLNYQKTIGGGVMSHVIEHLGDIIHRITHHAVYDCLYRDIAEEKSQIVLSKLKSAYGFMREHKENIVSNAMHDNIDADNLNKKSNDMLKIYANEHKKLPSYNLLHHWCKIACVAIGEQNIPLTIKTVEKIHELTLDQDKFLRVASTVYKDGNDKVVIYEDYLENYHCLNHVLEDFSL